MKKAYIFPGQGSQTPGMGRILYETNAQARELMNTADKVLGFALTDKMFNGDAEALKATDVTQPAIFLHSITLFLCSGLSDPDMAGGHSLGEYSALAAAGVLGFEDALILVSKRAAAMQKCCLRTSGTMAAIIGLPDRTIEQICSGIDGIVVPANYNNEGQVVISGETEAVAKACEALKAAGARRALTFPVGGAFHSPLMEDARAELASAIDATRFYPPKFPVYQNVDARPETDPDRIKDKLLMQLVSPVRWTESVRNMMADGATQFTEIGPGTVLQGLVKRIVAGSDTLIITNGIQ